MIAKDAYKRIHGPLLKRLRDKNNTEFNKELYPGAYHSKDLQKSLDSKNIKKWLDKEAV
jgi:hypothetical protein